MIDIMFDLFKFSAALLGLLVVLLCIYLVGKAFFSELREDVQEKRLNRAEEFNNRLKD